MQGSGQHGSGIFPLVKKSYENFTASDNARVHAGDNYNNHYGI
jgi:hypothetical protein